MIFKSVGFLGSRMSLLVLLTICVMPLYAEGESVDGTITYYNIRTPRFVRPLVERWIKEYAKVRPDVNLRVQKGCEVGDHDMQVVIRRTGADGHSMMYFGEYAVFPVTTQGSAADRLLKGKTLSTERIRTIFFDKNADEYDNAEDMEIDAKSPMKKLVVYSGNDTTSVASLFADFYGEQMSSIRGKRVSGDDAFLINAIAADSFGVTFNALPNIYDLKTRTLKQSLSLLRMNTDDEVEDVMRNDATLDEVLTVLEQADSEYVPTADIGIVFDANNAVVREFLNWVITSGVRYNHQYGILTLDKRMAEQQAMKVRYHDTAQQ